MKTETTEILAIIDEAKKAGCENDAMIMGYLAAEISRLRGLASAAPTPGDTEMLEWLIAGGYGPAQWRPWERHDGPHYNFPNGMVMTGPCTRETIRAAMNRASLQRPARDGGGS